MLDDIWFWMDTSESDPKVRRVRAKGRFVKPGIASRINALFAGNCERKCRSYDGRDSSFERDTGVSIENSSDAHAGSISDESAPPTKKAKFPIVGRRAVHLETLADGLSRCQNPSCSEELHLNDCLKEKRYGLGSVLSIRCRSCSFSNSIDTDRRVDSPNRHSGPRPFVSNKKAALGE